MRLSSLGWAPSQEACGELCAGRPWLPANISPLPQVQDAVKCRVVDRQEEGNGDSGGSFQNGHAQLMVGLGASRSSLFLEFCWAQLSH